MNQTVAPVSFPETLTKVRINYDRVFRERMVYVEGFLADNGKVLRTYSVVPKDISQRWSVHWHREGFLSEDQWIGVVRKYLFYDQYFAIMELRDDGENLLGYYCDIVTPLRKGGAEYYVQDLCLDLWVAPDLTCQELDWDEFDEAVETGRIPSDLNIQAQMTLEALVREVQQGDFPGRWIRD